MSDIRFETLGDYQQQLGLALAGATRRVDWFDMTMAEVGLELADRAESLRQMLAGSALARVRLLVFEDDWFWRHGAGVAALMTTYGHVMELRVADECDRLPGEQFLLTDQVVVRRFHPDTLRGVASDDARSRILCQQQFDSMWPRAQPAASGRRLYI